MKIFLHTFLFTLTLALVSPVFSQNPVATPPPIEDGEVVKISTTLIQVDATVTDRRGRIIRNLKPEDFEVFENGKKQEITAFSFISAKGVRTTKPLEKTKKEPLVDPPIPTKLKPEQIRRTIALVVDDLSLSFESVHFVRRALRKFVNEQVQEGDLVAIIRTGGGIGALQQFTFDKRQLSAAIEKLRWNPSGSGGVGAFAAIEATRLEQARANGEDISDEEIEEERGRIRENEQFREDVFATGTLGAINFVIRGMKELPGRKSVILLSDGFQLFSVNRNGFGSSGRVLDSVRRLVDLANRASVVIYSVDSRGLQTADITAADNTAGLSAAAIQQRGSERRAKLFDTQGGLQHLSKETGGFAIVNNNDIAGGIEKILDDQSYYLLGYEPDTETFDPEKRRFNKLEVKVKVAGLKVRYRSGFFGVTDTKPDTVMTSSPQQTVLNALTSPFAINAINLNLNTIFKSTGKKKLELSSFLHIDTRDLTFKKGADGRNRVSFDVIAMNFGDNGVPLGQTGKTYTISVDDNQLQRTLEEGFVYFFAFPVEKPGAYQMRVALRDHASGTVGSASQFTKVPKIKKDRLTLSGFAVENLTYKQWAKSQKTGERITDSDPLLDTALRRFSTGTVLTYGFEIYNAKSGKNQKPVLEMRSRVFYNGKLLYEGKDAPIGSIGQVRPSVFAANGAINLGTEMEPGEYVLQVVVTDKRAKRKKQIATQFVQFEIVE